VRAHKKPSEPVLLNFFGSVPRRKPEAGILKKLDAALLGSVKTLVASSTRSAKNGTLKLMLVILALNLALVLELVCSPEIINVLTV
jgi:hypothetical protein